MKKVVSIFMVVLLLATMFQLTLSTHYCGGEVAATRISLSGELASCGMEGTEDSCPIEGRIQHKSCCEDFVTVFSTDNTYTPSPVIAESFSNISNNFLIPEGTLVPQQELPINQFSDVWPPGYLMSTDVDLSCICVFRI